MPPSLAAGRGGAAAEKRRRTHADRGSRGGDLKRVELTLAEPARRRGQPEARGELRAGERLIRDAGPRLELGVEHVRVPVGELRNRGSAFGEPHAHHGWRGGRSWTREERRDALPHHLRLLSRDAEVPDDQRAVPGDGDEPPAARADERGAAGGDHRRHRPPPRWRVQLHGAVLEEHRGESLGPRDVRRPGLGASIGPSHRTGRGAHDVAVPLAVSSLEHSRADGVGSAGFGARGCRGSRRERVLVAAVQLTV